MGISKQIGWSQEANLYYQISQQLDQLIKITSKSIVSYYSVDSCERMASHVIAYHGGNTLPVGTIVKNGTPECFYITGNVAGPADVGFVESFWGMNDCTTCLNTRKFLRIIWNDINDATAMIGGDVNDVSVWNNFFNLPIEGSPFFSVLVDGGIVILNNTGTIRLNTPFSLGTFSIADNGVVTSLGFRQVFYKTGITDISLNICTSIDDSSFYDAEQLTSVSLPSLVSVGVGAFESCIALSTFDFPLATTIGNQAFSGCTSATIFMLPSVTSLGEDVLDNGVFGYISGQTITLTIPSALMTCNSGDPDGDITALQLSGNTVTIIEV
jgi:hypothetical protein